MVSHVRTVRRNSVVLSYMIEIILVIIVFGGGGRVSKSVLSLELVSSEASWSELFYTLDAFILAYRRLNEQGKKVWPTSRNGKWLAEDLRCRG